MVEFFDVPVFNFINQSLSNHILNIAMPFISRMGGGELFFVIGFLLLFSRKKEFKTMGVVLLAGLTISYYAVSVLKVFIARPRPFVSVENAILLGHATKTYSFPSGHSTMSFMSAVLLSSLFKRHILFYLFAVAVCLSRVYMGMHYPSDVLAGALIGAAIGYFLVRINKRLVDSQ